MSGAATGRAPDRPPRRTNHSSDERLIQLCLKGDAEAWSALIDKYKNLIYSIPNKLGMYQDAGDIFQSVCVDLLAELPNLREHRALPKWLMQTCYHKCLQVQRSADRLVELDAEGAGSDPHLPVSRDEDLPEHLLVQLEQEQLLRDAILELPKKCEQMLKLLFFEIPPRSYETIAAELGMASGSIGAIRSRCLAHLRKYIEKRGF
jgi:RNA polymerase sigma factor (sigma-70 family)